MDSVDDPDNAPSAKAETLAVEKRLRLKEELHLRSETADETVEVPVTLRKQRAVVERQEPDAPKTT